MNEASNLVRQLPEGPLDVVGDIHGEYDALVKLMRELGYNSAGEHPDQRKLIFVGDLCDRGPNSVKVIRLVQQLMQAGRAHAILGNHEINLLRSDAKDGSGWYFDERVARDERYSPFARPDEQQRTEIVDFLKRLPLVLERSDLRLVHAAWQSKDIALARSSVGMLAHELYDRDQSMVDSSLVADGSLQRYKEDTAKWRVQLEDANYSQMPFLEGIAHHDARSQADNPVRVLTSGVERRAEKPFFSSHKWRFVERVSWWDDYQDDIPVIIGHYWRMAVAADRSVVGKGDKDLFDGIKPNEWLGARKNVFCVDFSVGGRWHERRDKLPLGQRFKLAAMRWPERSLFFDTGETLQT